MEEVELPCSPEVSDQFRGYIREMLSAKARGEVIPVELDVFITTLRSIVDDERRFQFRLQRDGISTAFLRLAIAAARYEKKRWEQKVRDLKKLLEINLTKSLKLSQGEIVF